MSEPVKRCKQCGEVKPLAEFVRNAHGRGLAITNPNGRRARCFICESHNRTEDKRDARERHKARSTRRSHAARLADSPHADRWARPVTLESLTEFYGWTNDAVEADIVEAVEAGVCGSCGHPFDIRPGGALGDVQVDILDPTRPPFWRTNTRVVCATCNRQKGGVSAHDMALQDAERRALVLEAEREAARRALGPVDPDGVPTLFDLDGL